MSEFKNYWNNYNLVSNIKNKSNKPKGIKNKTINPKFIEFCKFEKAELKSFLAKELSKYYKNVISRKGYLYVKGKDKVCLTAHMDTTPNVDYGKRKLVKNFYENNENGKHIIQSPEGIGGDDRCGIYMIMEILERTDYRPSIVFCEDEEIGCIGSSKFADSKFIKDLEKMLFVIELDRHGKDDMVFYDDINEKFHEFVGEVTGYTLALGSCSDISYICPECKVSGVNLSCGYYNEHHDYETVVLEEMENTIDVTIKLINEGLKRNEQFVYEEKIYTNNWNRYDWDYGYYRSNRYLNNPKSSSKVTLYVEWDNGYGDYGDAYYEGNDINEAWVNFFLEHTNISFDNVTDYEEYDEESFYEYVSK